MSSSSFKVRAPGRRAHTAVRIVAACGITVLCGALGAGRGAALDDARPERVLPTASASVSSGLPWTGRLLHAVRLPTSASLGVVSEYARSGNYYGTSEMVALLEHAARAIAARWPGSQLSVGELSGPRGGKLNGHRSHRNGRDVDIAFFMRDAQGRAAALRSFVACRRDGSAQHLGRTLYFDDAKNWAMVAAMLRAPEARVQYMFVAKRLRARLLLEGRRQGESDELLRAAAAVMVQPRRGHKHANHFHVRIYCSRGDRPRCQDRAPFWPWYERSTPAGAVAEPSLPGSVPSPMAPRPASGPPLEDLAPERAETGEMAPSPAPDNVQPEAAPLQEKDVLLALRHAQRTGNVESERALAATLARLQGAVAP
jgi:penicillin-insensitive murein endopeptidase